MYRGVAVVAWFAVLLTVVVVLIVADVVGCVVVLKDEEALWDSTSAG